MQNDITRRTFVSGLVASGVGAAAFGIAGCTTAEEPAEEPAPEVEAEPAPEAEPAAEAEAAPEPAPAPASGAGKHTWEVAPEPITDIAETMDFDIVIVGAGIAGNAAAEAAARNGAKVAVLEQAGDFSVHGVDAGHIGSKFQKANGIDINPYEATKLLYLWSQQTANRNLILTWALKSGEVFDYFEELCAPYGITPVIAASPTAKTGWDELEERFREYRDAVAFSDLENDMGLLTKDGQMVTYHLISILNQEAEKNGTEFFYNTHAEQLVGDAKNGISGVIATAADGSHIQFNASKGVILATGDIGGNQEMIDVWAPICNRADGCVYSPPKGNNGDGILMGMWAGAAHQFGPAAPMIHPVDLSPTAVLTAISMCWLAVNTEGKRYGNEMPFEPIVTNARMCQPGNVAFNIFDADYPAYVQKQFPETYEMILEGVEDALAGAIEEGKSFRADTIEELAGMIGAPADELQKTIDRYNELCDKGVDEDFGVPERFLAPVKNGPFTAQKIPAVILVVPFGLHVNLDSQVCTQEDEPIKGLFAVGNVQGDFFANSYPVHCPGISVGRGLTFGQLVGEALAKDTVITAM